MAVLKAKMQQKAANLVKLKIVYCTYCCFQLSAASVWELKVSQANHVHFYAVKGIYNQLLNDVNL